MRGIKGITALAIIIVVFSASSALAGFGVRAYGGLDYIRYSDYNDFADYLNDKVFPGIDVTEEMDNIHWILEGGGEVLFSTLPWFTFGVGAGMIYGKADLNINISGDGLSFEHKIKSYPVTGTIYFKPSIPLLMAKPYFYAGAGIYFCRMYFTQMITSGGITDGYDAELSKSGFGVHGGAGIEFAVFPTVSISVEVKGRMAKVKGFEGTATRTDGEKMDVYVASYVNSNGDVIYGPESIDDKDKYAEGALDLSGFGAALAFKIFF